MSKSVESVDSPPMKRPSTATYSMATLNVQGADNLADADKARGAAESGLRWMASRFVKMARPKTKIGQITPAVATTLWPSIRASVAGDFAAMLTSGERTLTWDGTTYTSSPIATDNGQGTFVLQIRQHPMGAGDPLDATYIRVTSIGSYSGSTKSASLDFKIDKKVKFARAIINLLALKAKLTPAVNDKSELEFFRLEPTTDQPLVIG